MNIPKKKATVVGKSKLPLCLLLQLPLHPLHRVLQEALQRSSSEEGTSKCRSLLRLLLLRELRIRRTPPQEP